MFENIFNSVPPLLLLLLPVIIFSFLFLSHFLFPKKVHLLKRGKYSILFDSGLYSISIRWIGIVIIKVFSLVRKKEKTYFQFSNAGKYDEESIDKELLNLLGKEKHYSYSLFVLKTISYFQKLSNLKKAENKYKGLLGKLKMHAEANHSLTPKRLKALTQARFDYDRWIPSQYEEYLLKNEPQRQDRYNELKRVMQLSKGDLAIETRTVGKNRKKRFDISREK